MTNNDQNIIDIVIETGRPFQNHPAGTSHALVYKGEGWMSSNYDADHVFRDHHNLVNGFYVPADGVERLGPANLLRLRRAFLGTIPSTTGPQDVDVWVGRVSTQERHVTFEPLPYDDKAFLSQSRKNGVMIPVVETDLPKVGAATKFICRMADMAVLAELGVTIAAGMYAWLRTHDVGLTIVVGLGTLFSSAFAEIPLEVVSLDVKDKFLKAAPNRSQMQAALSKTLALNQA